MTARCSLLVAAGLTAAPALASAQTVHVVDDDGPADFADLDAAVDAAAPGDMVLVRDGTYTSFSLTGKGIVIAADQGANVALRFTSFVSDVPAGQELVLSGLTSGTGTEPSVLTLTGCEGEVWIQDCDFTGVALHFLDEPCVRVTDCHAVVVTGSSFRGFDSTLIQSDGGAGLRIEDSNVHVYDSTITGGRGNTVASLIGPILPALPGGSGVDHLGGFLRVEGSTIQGGEGGRGQVPQAPFIAECSDGGPGGAALALGAGAHAELRTATLVPGAGGEAVDPCNDGAAGVASDVDPAATLVVEPWIARNLGTGGPLREGEAGTVAAAGEPSELVWIGVSAGTSVAPTVPQLGVLLFELPYYYVFLGATDGAGELVVPYVVNAFQNPAREFVGIRAQGLFWEPLSGALTLGGARVLLHLDASL